MGDRGRITADADRYERHECIGRGSYGDVYRGVDRETGKQVAIKVIDLEDIEDDIDDIHKEIAALAGCQCEHITDYYASVIKPGSSELLIIMELLTCCVADLLQHGPLEERFIAYICWQVLLALDYLHHQNRIHRDIKAANILLGSSGSVKVSDFGVSGQLTGTLGFRRRTFVGTPYWMAPEVIESSEEGYTARADIWSVGISAIEMALTQPPHADLHPMRVLFIIPRDPAPRLDPEGPHSPEFQSFVVACLQKDPSARPSAPELLAHPFVATAAARGTPEGLSALVAETSRRRMPLPPQRGSSPEGLSAQLQATLPVWDFATKQAPLRPAVPLAPSGLVAKAGDTLKTAVVDRYVAGRGMSGGGSSSLGLAPSGSLVAMSAVGVEGAVAAAVEAAGTGGGGTLRAEGGWSAGAAFTDAGYGSTVYAPRSAVAAAAATTAGAGGTVIFTKGGAAAVGAAAVGGAGAVGGRAVHERAPQLKQLSVDVARTAPGAGPPPGEVTILPRLAQADGGSGESAGVLTHLLLPALRSLGGGSSAAAAAADALRALERELPGSCGRLLSEAILQLSVSDARELRKLRAGAAGMFGAGATRGALGGTGAAAGLGHDSGRFAPDLGPLGSYLMSCWREDSARAAAAAARQRAL